MRLIEQARKLGKEKALNVIETIKLRPDAETPQLLSQHELQAIVPDNRPSIPPLPDSARLAQCFLPTHPEDPNEDWFDRWDSSHLIQVSPWLAEYIRYSHSVSPEGFVDFHISSGLWSLATVASRRIYVPLAKRIYTPLAIALVARTSLFAKTTTANAAMNVLKTAGLGWLLGDDETTPQKLLSDMAGHIPTNYQDMDFDQQMQVDRRVGMSGQVGWYYDEFNQLIDAMTRPGPMAEFAGLLRKLDDCPDEYKYSTKSGGREVIQQPYLPLLANTTPANLRKHASKGGEFWNDGFWARFAFITPPPDAWKTETMLEGEVIVPKMLSDSLREWNRRLGVPNCRIEEITDAKDKKTGQFKVVRDPLPSHPVMIDQDAYQAYKRYREATRAMIAESGNQDLDGSYVRLSDKALRIAAIIASLENDNQINLPIWTLAQEIAEMFRRNLHELYNQVSTIQERVAYLKMYLLNFSKSNLLKPSPPESYIKM